LRSKLNFLKIIEKESKYFLPVYVLSRTFKLHSKSKKNCLRYVPDAKLCAPKRIEKELPDRLWQPLDVFGG